MSSNFPDLESRMRAQEAMSTILHAQVYGMQRDKADSAAVTEVKEAVTEVKTEVVTLRTDLNTFQSSVDQRFDHVYGELADLKSNMIEIRDLLATLIAKLEK